MQMRVYALSHPKQIQALRGELEKTFSHLIETHSRTDLTLYDTFDWRLFKKGRLLIKQGSRLVITDLSSGDELFEWHSRAVHPPKFWWDYPDSKFKERLRPLLGIRGLGCLSHLNHEQSVWRLLNEDEKTVVRIVLEKVAVDGQNSSVNRCVLSPVRGYRKEANKAAKILAAADLKEVSENAYLQAVVQAGMNPGGYSSKINIALTPELSSREAVLRLLSHLVGVMRINEEGIRRDIDSEFLHDFRVAVRRSRSLLGQVKHVFDPETTAKLQSDLRALGKLTNRLRDLDVYLLMQSHYEGLVPKPLRPGVIQLFRALKIRRHNEMKKLAAAMDSNDYTAVLENLEQFVQQNLETGGSSPNALHPVIETAKTVITKRYRKIIKSGGKITPATPNQKIHDLRIECKKLRYLLEFFASLFPAKEMKTLIKQLRILQDNLGTFNDLSVQQDFLYNYLKNMRAQSKSTIQLAASAGGLICRLNSEQINVRNAFFVVFKQFDSKDNRKRFANLFVWRSML